ncbi:MAG: hypothetical protein A4E55_02443 [Pelotomaculum sp. PtaU1.Bin035]|nr:MAG: hypothetical protein A4E55_02443 [Pelotomaculum sp. PtaU1.Bin035]
MKGKNGILYLCAALFALTVIGGVLCASPALAWDTWPAATNNDPNHTWTVVFDQAMNTETINSENVYISNDITGSSRVSGVSVYASDNTHALVAPPTGGWNTDTNYYLIITRKVLTSAGMPLKDEVRMPFLIAVKTRETPTIDVIDEGSNITVKVNGNQLSFDQPPYIANGRTMVPFRTIAEAIGAEVDWDQASQKITIMGDRTIELTVNSTIARVNGASVTLDNPAVVAGGRTMVPLRFVGEALGAKVNYTSGSQFEQGAGLKTVDIPVKVITTRFPYDNIKEKNIPSSISVNIPADLEGKLCFYHGAEINVLGPVGWTGKGSEAMNGEISINLYAQNDSSRFIEVYETSSYGAVLEYAAPFFPSAAEEAAKNRFSSSQSAKVNIKNIVSIGENIVTYEKDGSPCTIHGAASYKIPGKRFFIRVEAALPENERSLAKIIINDFVERNINGSL